jgi:YHS domain-containing protein
MRVRSLTSLLIVALCAASHLFAAEKEFKATCPVAGKPASKDISMKFEGKKLYFDSQECMENFKKNRKPFVVKANRQLVETGQAVQVGCPTCGRPCVADFTLDVGGIKVLFGCPGSKGRVEVLEPEERIAAVFGGRSFSHAFTLQTECVVCGEPIDRKCSTLYNDRKVFFCSDPCKKEFEKSPEKFAKKLPKLRKKKEAE